MSEAWFFCEALGVVGETIVLDPTEARHAAASRRLNEGDPITLFDGSGNVAIARLGAIERKGRDVRAVIESIAHQPPLDPAVHLVCALPKGERQSVLLSMATQIGMTSFTPLRCERSIAAPGRGFADRARRICIEACKQSRQAHVPQINEALTLNDAIVRGGGGGGLVLLAHPTGGPLAASARDLSRSSGITTLIGPEGGFTDEEITRASASDTSARLVSLGDSILRTEAAAVAAIAFLRLGLACSR